MMALSPAALQLNMLPRAPTPAGPSAYEATAILSVAPVPETAPRVFEKNSVRTANSSAHTMGCRLNKKSRWCGSCAKTHAGAVGITNKKCEDCHIKWPNYGLPWGGEETVVRPVRKALRGCHERDTKEGVR